MISLRPPSGLSDPPLLPPRPTPRQAAPALALFVAIRALCLVTLVIWSQLAGRSAHELLSRRWDSLWYVRVADLGYGYTLHAPDGRDLSSMAFFPLYPWLEKALSTVLFLSPADAGLLISALASVAAAWGIFAVAAHCYGRGTGVVLVGLWAALPVGIVQSMAYSESLFVALAAWALYAVLTGRWIVAGSLACLAGLTRPVGLAVSAALIVTAALGARTARPTVRIVAGCALAPLGAVAYILWVGARQGTLFGYLDVQSGWGNGFDGGLAFARFLADGMTGTPSAALAAVLLVALVLLAAWPHWIGVRQLQPPALVVYSAVVTVLAVGAAGYFGSKPRLLLPAFPLLLPLAVVLARSRPWVTYLTLTVMTTVAALYGAFWLNGSGPP
ncbi:hypothetical protein ACIO1C_17650 [Streptomyces sp. NPDC087420]|uniref:hypothetical protein n=1 Tax=Streptomyces sp. NPDC087420 TaxID=3365785 RepID=UPI003834F090